MQLARFLNKLFKEDGFILIDAKEQKYIIGNPKKEKPIILRLLDTVSYTHLTLPTKA